MNNVESEQLFLRLVDHCFRCIQRNYHQKIREIREALPQVTINVYHRGPLVSQYHCQGSESGGFHLKFDITHSDRYCRSEHRKIRLHELFLLNKSRILG